MLASHKIVEAIETILHSPFQGGNRTTCIVFFNDGQPKYTKTVATIFPLEKTSFQVDGTDIYDLELTSECELDPCYKIIKSPEDGHYDFHRFP